MKGKGALTWIIGTLTKVEHWDTHYLVLYSTEENYSSRSVTNLR